MIDMREEKEHRISASEPDSEGFYSGQALAAMMYASYDLTIAPTQERDGRNRYYFQRLTI